ncbi:MAG: hypothetical protein ABIJ47_15110, partial [Candidatus Bathyarchaeota archaeon]
MAFSRGYAYLVRVNSIEMLNQIKEIRRYYTGIKRNWIIGTPILFAKGEIVGDSIIGCGYISKIEEPWMLSRQEERYCIRNNFHTILSFNDIYWFKNPLPIKDTMLSADPRRGAYLHGYKMSEEN